MSERGPIDDYDLDTEETLDAYDRSEFRHELEVGKSYGYSSNIRRIIWNLEVGDEVLVQTYRKGQPMYHLWVTDDHLESKVAIEKQKGGMYILLGSYWGKDFQQDGRPWLRTHSDNQSRGEIAAIRVKTLHD